MSDFEDDCDDDSYEYPSEDEDEDEDEDEAGVAADWQRNVRVKESHSATAPLTHSLSPWMDADEQDFRLWGDGNALRMSIFSSLRQIVNSGGARKRVLCSRDELFGEGDVKTMRIFLEVAEVEAMTVVYTLSFNATKAMSMCPPLLKCISYCGRGTYLFPNLLLPNCLGQFVDFGKVFNTLATELAQYKPSFSSFVMVNEESPYYMVQELAYLTQYRTSFVFEVTDSGIVTGVERDRKVNPGDGIGYSSRSRAEVTNVQKDDSNQYQLTTIMVQIDKIFNEKLLDSPLPELLAGMITELSVEEITRSAPYASSIFKLVAALQAVYAKRGIGGFDTNTLYKLAIFKDILMDEYGLDSITLPETIVAGLRNSSPHKQEHAKESQCGGDTAMELDDETDDDPVIFVDGLFTRHSYLSDVTTTGKAILKRMKIEFHTLSTTLPPSIRYMVSEENFSLGKFMIVGPVDTPYEGGFFLFDLKLPSDYPDTSPSVNFLTTGGGSVRFNPNLYNCGKVCLSLLGTWEGEKWDPQVSNINQVLQSICYLIFVEEPYFNEPGYRRNEQTAVESKHYNTSTRRSTVRAAYLDHLTHPDPYFGALILKKMHSTWDKTKEVFQMWASEDPTGSISEHIAEIEAKLSKNNAKNA